MECFFPVRHMETSIFLCNQWGNFQPINERITVSPLLTPIHERGGKTCYMAGKGVDQFPPSAQITTTLLTKNTTKYFVENNSSLKWKNQLLNV